MEAHNIEMDAEGTLFVGEQGSIMADFHGGSPQLFANGQKHPLELDKQTDSNSANQPRHRVWVDACHDAAPSPGSFLNAHAITDAVNLGTVALRAGKKVLFDSQYMKITNVAEANKYLVREYRQGWEL